MTEKNQIYKCEICGNIVEVLHEGVGQLVCCNQPMKLLKENTTDASKEKHVPVIEKQGNKIIVKIGEIPHPMTEEHYIEFIEILADNISYKTFLKPNQEPKAEFNLPVMPKSLVAREYCNLHGLWKKIS